ncbi:MAG: PP2C family protein-serine/threonine phosphatase [Candidatus Promineifilaceae bacterium]
MDDRKMLRRAFGDALDETALAALHEAATIKSYAPGKIILRQGQIGNALYVIIDGRVEVKQSLDDGQEIILDTIQPGQYIGELALIDQSPRMATCRTLTKVTALRFDKSVFDRMMHENPAVAGLVLQHVIQNMRSQDQLIIQELRQTNEALRRAYAELQEAQASLVEKERLEHELALAAEAQKSLLPGDLPDLPPFRFAAYQRPAHQVGGDFYDVIDLDEDHVGILLADVSDKGLHAALIMGVARTLFRTEARRSLSPAAVALAVHKGLLELDRTQETFLTAFYGILHRPSCRLTYVRAAQEKPLLLRSGEPITALEGGDRFLGMIEDLTLNEYQISLQQGDKLILFSDGVPDAANKDLESYGYGRLAESGERQQHLSAAELVKVLVDDIDRWTMAAEAFDDLTLLAVELSGNIK